MRILEKELRIQVDFGRTSMLRYHVSKVRSEDRVLKVTRQNLRPRSAGCKDAHVIPHPRSRRPGCLGSGPRQRTIAGTSPPARSTCKLRNVQPSVDGKAR